MKAAFIATSLILIFVGQALYLAAANSTVSDEVAHLGAGYSYLKEGHLDLNPEHPPFIKQLAALPLLFMNLKFPSGNEQYALGRAFLYQIGNPAERMIFFARAVLLPFAVFLGMIIFLWTRDLFGPKAACFSLLLFAFFPELIIHSSLVTTDFAATTFFFTAFFFLFRYQRSSGKKDLYLAGITAGVALISKFSTILILPLVYFFSIFLAFGEKEDSESFNFSPLVLTLITAVAVLHRMSALIFAAPLIFFWGKRLFPRFSLFQNKRLGQAMAMILVVLSISFLIVMMDYYEYHYWFEKFRPLKRYFRGWSIFSGHSTAREHQGFLLDRFSGSGWWYYYLVAMLVKIPLPILLAVGLGKFYLWKFRPLSAKDLSFLAIPPAFFLVIACFVNTVNIGVRHVLPVYPFLLVIAGGSFAWAERLGGKMKSLLPAFLGFWLIAGSLRAFPNYLSYFNEIAPFLGGKENILGDSNISWGQDLRRLRDYVRSRHLSQIQTVIYFNFSEEMDYYQLPHVEGSRSFKLKEPGLYVLDIYTYQGLVREPGYEWLKNRRPDDRIGGSFLVFKL